MNVLHTKAAAMNVYTFYASDMSWNPIKGSTETYPEKVTGLTNKSGTYYYAHSFRGFMIYSGSGNAAKSFPKFLQPDEPLPSDIKAVQNDGLESDSPIYDLEGRRMTKGQLHKGCIYIKNGKKMVM